MAVVRGTTDTSWHSDDRPITWDLSNLEPALKSITITNTGSQDLLYKVLTKLDKQAETEIVEFYNSSDNPLEPNESAVYHLRHRRDWIAVDVAAVSGTTTFEIQTSYQPIEEVG